ncbi:MAG: type III secretion system gatekeeper subunit SctW [Kiritimatiellae bacterium]|nr:type III secretion system gatekeeper subunit SctW [Kiritimatiellia bacterium]
MAFDPVQMLRQTYAQDADALRMMELASGKGAEAAGAKAAETGTINGTAFQVQSDPLSELMDSMEELSFQFEEKAQKKISDRKMGEMQGPRTAYLKAIEAWQATFPDMPDAEFLAKLMRMARQAMARGGAFDAQDLLKELSRGSTDPSHQFAMLDILEQGCADAEGDLKALVREARAQLEKAKGPEIRAGLNLAQEINARAGTPGEMQNLRDLYRGEVVGFTSPQQCFRSLLASSGPEGLRGSIEFLIASCGIDMQSASPSLSSEALGRILTDLQCVDVLQTVLDDLTALADRMGSQFGEKCLLDGQQLSGRVLDFTEQAFVAPGGIAALVTDCGIMKLLAQMDFSRELIRLFRRLSPRLFARESDRKQLVDAAQEHLDGLVMKEMEEEEEGAA